MTLQSQRKGAISDILGSAGKRRCKNEVQGEDGVSLLLSNKCDEKRGTILLVCVWNVENRVYSSGEAGDKG